MYKVARIRNRDYGRLVDGFFTFLLAPKGLGKTILYNTTRDVNKHGIFVLYINCFPIKPCPLCLALLLITSAVAAVPRSS